MPASLGDHGRRDLGEGLVQLVLLVGVVDEDQVGLEVCDGLNVRVGALTDLAILSSSADLSENLVFR